MNKLLFEQANNNIIIIGAGAAGLTLMLALDELDYPHNVTVVERNKSPLNDRVWSFWDNKSGATCMPLYLKPIVSHEWTSWTFSTDQRSYVMKDSTFAYCSIRSEDLSMLAQKCANEKANFNIIYNYNVTSVTSNENMWQASNEQEHLIAHKIIDTRPPPIDKNHSGLLQCFYGEEIIVDADIFEPSSVKLMHQMKYSELGIEFVYILPFSKNRALVEFTCFSITMVALTILKARLAIVIKELVMHHKYLLERSEKAVLPMYFINQNNQKALHKSNDIVYAGIAGGAMRASTGFSFVSNQRWAEKCAAQLHLHDSIAKHAPINFIYATMDSIMLKVLLNDLSIGVIIFEQMFKKVKPDSFARFMTQQATFSDFIAVITAMPKLPFCKAAVQNLFRYSLRNILTKRKLIRKNTGHDSG